MTKKSDIKKDLHNLNLILKCYSDNNLIASLQYARLVADCYNQSTEDTEKCLFASIFEDIQITLESAWNIRMN